MRRRAALKEAEKPHSARAAGAGGSSSTMLRLNTDDNKGLSVDPVVVLVLSVAFVFSVVLLHILGKVVRYFSK
ncbi:Arf guanine nucleotide exchange factor sbh1 [Malassezia japonica]|uniref:Arf guanine nucleotide exchange factor sbh1 n=1 Tax=Malassezia japonica TaxID=223818 RepID=A0AAF0JEV6_9BASI|nr:Arf guanine nucleotide exchange factor sbh1 [Malassezia japonica]WFD38326.1 Arf guanine nucleotide exchange factor sbh1 [Malassezia japonica]